MHLNRTTAGSVRLDSISAIPTALCSGVGVARVADTVSKKLLEGHRATELNASLSPTAVDKNMQSGLERVDSKAAGKVVETVDV